MIKIQTKNHFDLDQIEKSGQCFRWKPIGIKEYLIPAYKKVLKIKQINDELILDTNKDDYEKIWKSYFDLETDYSKILSRINEEDKILYSAINTYPGLRILKQENFETLITFIISQQKTIPGIKKGVELFTKYLGSEENQINDFKLFPTIKESYDRIENLPYCRLGYREKYIRETIKILFHQPKLLKDLEILNDRDLKTELKRFPGVGEKVANCVMLFSYHRLNAFPKDVWINRILKAFPEDYNFSYLEPYSGVYQQYLFCLARDRKNK